MTELLARPQVAVSPKQATILQSHQLVAEATSGSGKVLGPMRIVVAWHNEVHPGVFRFCDEQPCHALNHTS